MDKMIEMAFRVINRRTNGSRRISMNFVNEPVLIEMVRRGLAVWETPMKMSVLCKSPD